MPYRTDVEGLRALAVLPIVLSHVGFGALSGGFVGVDVFFVISGFVIARSITSDIDAGRFHLGAFYFRRACRILPALLVVVALTTIAAVVLMLPEDLESYFRSVAAVGGFVSNVFFWKSSGYFEAAAQTRPLLHTWSLAVEEQFYLLAPAALAWLYRSARRQWVTAILLVAACSLAVSIDTVAIAPRAGYFLLPARMWELLLGAAIALTSAAPFSRTLPREIMAAGGMAMIVGATLFLDERSPFPGWNALFPCLGALLVILAGAGAGRRPIVNRLLARPVPRWIGRISYSLYLVHWPLIALFRYRMLRAPTIAEAAAIVAVSIGLAALSWRFVEEPARRWAHRRPGTTPEQRRVLLAAVLASMTLVVGGLAGAATRGIPERFPDYRRVRLAGQEQWGGATCFNEDPSLPIAWDADRCTRLRGSRGRILLWGDSHAAHYVPGLIARQRQLDRDVLQYTFAGCPPILAYHSAARPGCSLSNARVPGLVRALKIDHVVLAARWEEAPMHTLARLGETIAALRVTGVRVSVVGPSPIFGAWPQTIDYLSGQDKRRIGAAVNTVGSDVIAVVRGQAAQAAFVDPTASLCRGKRCPYRIGAAWLYADDSHLHVAGSAWAADLFMLNLLQR